MTCPTCQGDSSIIEDSPKYCGTCAGYGCLCDTCEGPALSGFPEDGVSFCFACALDRMFRKQNRILFKVAAAVIAVITAIIVITT